MSFSTLRNEVLIISEIVKPNLTGLISGFIEFSFLRNEALITSETFNPNLTGF
jgi:hypothetical protein